MSYIEVSQLIIRQWGKNSIQITDEGLSQIISLKRITKLQYISAVIL